MATAPPATGSAPPETAGPAHVGVVSFLAARAAPTGGFWIALAGGVALARVAERLGPRLGFGASAPENAAGFAGAIVLGVACFAGMGVGAASLIRSAEGVSAVVNVIVLPMAFLAGSFGPRDDLPAFLQTIADVLPLTYFLEIVDGVYLDGESLFADPGAFAIVAAWGLAGLLVALRWFGWVPRDR